MFSSSTQKRHWTFSSQEALNRAREEANQAFRSKYDAVIEPGEDVNFLSAEEELQLCKLVTETGIRFSHSFRPPMWPGVRWSAFAYFKRFYVRHSAMEYSPKSVMMGCFYLAAKIEEFNVSIDDFIRNLRSGTPESNTETILSLEPVIMLKLDYHLTVHSPFRPMEGHLIDMKNSDCCANVVDLECVRPGAEKFYQKGLVTDVMLLFPPAQIALAAVRHGLLLAGKPATIVDDYVHSKLLPEDATSANKLIARLDEIIECVERQGQIQPQETTDRLQTRMQQWNKLQIALEQRTKMRVSGPGGGGGLAGDEANNSDDDD